MKYYAGIGSRDTPKHILKIMHHCAAYLATQGWTLRSGHADNADQAFEHGASDGNGDYESYLPWAGFNHSVDGISPKDYPFTDEEMAFTAKFHPNWKKCSPSARLLHQRNTRIVLGLEAIHGPDVTPVSFILCWTEGGSIQGGTGQALRIAQALDIPVINFGKATNTEELEQLVLRVDEYQTKLGN